MSTGSLIPDLEIPAIQRSPSELSTRKVLKTRCLLDRYLVVRDHVARIQHIRCVWRYELEEKLRVLVRNYRCRLVAEGGTPPRSVCVSPIHDHLKVHSLDPIEALFSVAGAEYKGREQERLGDFEFYILLCRQYLGQSFDRQHRANIYA